ncbi:hypothetical protein ACRZTK_004417 [Enterobacter asburiae]
MNKLQRSLMMMTLLTASLSTTAAGIVTGTQQTVTRNLVVAGTATANITLTPATNILAGSANKGLVLGTFSASTTGGTIAVRLNPTVIELDANYSYGYIKNNANATQKIYVGLFGSTIGKGCMNNGAFTGSAPILTGQWWVCSEGADEYQGEIRNSLLQNLIGGTYPVAVDAVAWTS